MNKPSQCRCPFQLISDIHQCHISPCNPSVINHLQQRSHFHLGISEHAQGKVAALGILLWSLLIQIFTGLRLGGRGTRAQTCQIMQINQNHCPGTNTWPCSQSRPPTHSAPHRFPSLPYICFPTDKQAPASGNNLGLLQFLLD